MESLPVEIIVFDLFNFVDECGLAAFICVNRKFSAYAKEILTKRILARENTMGPLSYIQVRWGIGIAFLSYRIDIESGVRVVALMSTENYSGRKDIEGERVLENYIEYKVMDDYPDDYEGPGIYYDEQDVYYENGGKIVMQTELSPRGENVRITIPNSPLSIDTLLCRELYFRWADEDDTQYWELFPVEFEPYSGEELLNEEWLLERRTM